MSKRVSAVGMILIGAVAGWLAARPRGAVPVSAPIDGTRDRPPTKAALRLRRRRRRQAVVAGLSLFLAGLAAGPAVFEIIDRAKGPHARTSDLFVQVEDAPAQSTVGYAGYAVSAGVELPAPGTASCDDAARAAMPDQPTTTASARVTMTNTYDGQAGSTAQLFVYDLRLDIRERHEPLAHVEYQCGDTGGVGISDILLADTAAGADVTFVDGQDSTRGRPAYTLAPGESVAFDIGITSRDDAEVVLVATVRRGDGTDESIDLTDPLHVAGTDALLLVVDPAYSRAPSGEYIYSCGDAHGSVTTECVFEENRAPALAEIEDFLTLRAVESGAGNDLYRIDLPEQQ